jgi:hypothetical protein
MGNEAYSGEKSIFANIEIVVAFPPQFSLYFILYIWSAFQSDFKDFEL